MLFQWTESPPPQKKTKNKQKNKQRKTTVSAHHISRIEMLFQWTGRTEKIVSVHNVRIKMQFQWTGKIKVKGNVWQLTFNSYPPSPTHTSRWYKTANNIPETKQADQQQLLTSTSRKESMARRSLPWRSWNLTISSAAWQRDTKVWDVKEVHGISNCAQFIYSWSFTEKSTSSTLKHACPPNLPASNWKMLHLPVQSQLSPFHATQTPTSHQITLNNPPPHTHTHTHSLVITDSSQNKETNMLQASLSGTFLQTLPKFIMPMKGHSLSLSSCPPTLSAHSTRFG